MWDDFVINQNLIVNKYFLPFSKIVIGILFVVVSCNSIHTEALIGEWEGDFSGSRVIVRFENNHDFQMEMINKESGESEFINGKFRMDTTKRPIPITIYNISELSHPLHAVFELVNEDSLRLSLFTDRQRLRPLGFDAENTLNLSRK